jgi:hypothetical protein
MGKRDERIGTNRTTGAVDSAANTLGVHVPNVPIEHPTFGFDAAHQDTQERQSHRVRASHT